MSRYIDADKLFLNFNDWAFAESPDERHSDLPEYSEHKIHEMIYRTINEAMSAIEQQPTADVVEVKHGEWIELYENNYKCSTCGDWWETIEGTPQDNGMNYCPHCGAKMGGEKNEIHYTKISV